MIDESTQLLNALERQHVERALERLAKGEQSTFADSTSYDVLYLGNRYPPKRVAGIALSELTGKKFTPKSFKGRENSSCFKALQRCGFTIVRKAEKLPRGLQTHFDEVLELQKHYTSTNTPEMKRRGELIRQAIPDLLRSNLQAIEPIFTNAGFSCEVEGSDGVGLKNASPWVRVFDPLMSPSATQGWYIVLHFSRLGDTAYLTVGCGATTFNHGSLVKIASKELQRRVGWARSLAVSLDFDTVQFSDVVRLHGNELSNQFEQATAYAKGYPVGAIDDVQFWKDLIALSQLLIHFYECERTGKDPATSQPEVSQAQSEIEDVIRANRPSKKGQGRGLSHPERVAVELQAMAVARARLEELDFQEIVDVSKTHSCDFKGERDGKEWLIEVKGTTSSEANLFLLTAQELALHRSNQGRTVLVLVSGITLSRHSDGPKASSGSPEVFLPWEPQEWTFEATSFRAVRN